LQTHVIDAISAAFNDLTQASPLKASFSLASALAIAPC
jgi:hypothetical protein